MALLKLARFSGDFSLDIIRLESTAQIPWEKFADQRVPTTLVVKALNKLEDRKCGVAFGCKAIFNEYLTFGNRIEAFAHGVIVAITDRSHRGPNVCISATLAECNRCILGGFNRSEQHLITGGCIEI